MWVEITKMIYNDTQDISYEHWKCFTEYLAGIRVHAYIRVAQGTKFDFSGELWPKET